MKQVDRLQQEGADRIQAGFDFRNETKRAILEFDDGADWAVTAIDERSFYRQFDGSWHTGNVTREALGRGFPGATLFARFVYFISPDLRQVRLVVEIRAEAPSSRRGRSTVKISNRYEYLGPMQDVALRPWREGEKEALIDEINREHKDEVSRFPHNKDAYDKERAVALAVIEDRDTILPGTAMDEAWPDTKLEREFRLALDTMAEMVRKDMAFLRKRPRAKGRKQKLEGLSPSGKKATLWGRVFFSTNTHTIVQGRDGELYAAPIPESR